MKNSEPQYQYLWDKQNEGGNVQLGAMASETWRRDPKRLGFVLARYKLVSKVLAGKNRVLEVGCGDAWASNLVRETVSELYLTDFDEKFIKDAKKNCAGVKKFFVHDYTEKRSIHRNFDAIYLLDVFEHIPKTKEQIFIQNMLGSLRKNGVVVIGCPTRESQQYIPINRRDPGHVNCKNGDDFRKGLTRFFHNVFLFGMNDETLLTAPSHMCFYNIWICVGKV